MASATGPRRIQLPKSDHHRSRGAAAADSSRPAYPAVSISAIERAVPKSGTPLNSLAHFPPSDPSSSHSFGGIKNLTIVCCHAIFHPSPDLPNFPLCSPFREQNWHLAPFQRSNPGTGKPGEHATFMAHLSAGLQTLSMGPWAENSILIFSGGVTKSNLTPTSEARSYYHAALALALSQGHVNGGPVQALLKTKRLLLEEHATDSFQNLLFSILLFRHTTGVYPKQIRVITHAFKSKRFLELHAPAIRWPSDRIRVQGIDPVMSAKEYEETIQGENTYGYKPWIDDPMGMGEVLSRKRVDRGWDGAAEIPYLNTGLEDSVVGLLKGEAAVELPWNISIPSPPEAPKGEMPSALDG